MGLDDKQPPNKCAPHSLLRPVGVSHLPIVLGEDEQRRCVVSAPRTDNLQVHRGRAVEVQPFTPAFFGLHTPQRLLLPAFLRAQRLPGLRVVVRSGHGSEELKKSPVETKITASRSGGSSAAAKWESEESEPPMDPVHNKYVTQRLK